MDQGLAAVWAGVAGLVGAGIGGAAAVWGAAIGGRRTVEAAERQAQRTATAEHQHWLRQQRHDAYRALVLVVDEAMSSGTPTAFEVLDRAARVRQAVSAVSVLGPDGIGLPAVALLSPFADHLEQLRNQHASGSTVTSTTPAPWPPALLAELRTAYATYRLAVRDALNAPPS